MSDIPVLDPSEAPRARRWDVLVLGSSLSALVAAARIGAAGARVLVVEETARTQLPPALREPFALTGLRDEGVLDAVLRALTVPLIDRRRLATEHLSHQVIADPLRLDAGPPALTADEWVSWGLAKPDVAVESIRHLAEASELERKLLLEAPFVRFGRRLGAALANSAPGMHRRGLPGQLASADGPLRRVLDAQLDAFSNLGRARPLPEAQARLLGLPLAGGAGFSGDPPWLIDLLRKRVTSLYGEFRRLTDDFELISVSGQPGVRVARSGELWLGRRLLLAAPPTAIARCIARAAAAGKAPSCLDRASTHGYRAAFLFRVPVAVLPEGMGARLILPARSDDEGTATVTAFPSQTRPQSIDLVVRARIPEPDPERIEAQEAALAPRLAERLRDLMPFCGDQLELIEVKRPQWDSDDGWLEDPPPDRGWPGDVDLRLSTRPPIDHLDRAAAAGLGLEGDLLLGWRAGDAIAAEVR